MSLGVLRCESIPTPFKVANAVPAVRMQGIEAVHEDNAMHVVSNITIIIA